MNHFASFVNLVDVSDFMDIWNVSVKDVVVKVVFFRISWRFCEFLDFAINCRNESNRLMWSCLNSETQKVKNLFGHLSRVKLSVPNLDIYEQRVWKAFQFVQNQSLSIFRDCLFRLNGNNFKLSWNVMICQSVSMLKNFLQIHECFMWSYWVFLKNGLWRFFCIKPSVSTVETFSKNILFSFFKLNTIFWKTNFCLYIILFNNPCNIVWADMLILESSVNFIETVWNDWTEFLSSWHFELMFFVLEFWKFNEILFLISTFNKDSDKNFNFVY